MDNNVYELHGIYDNSFNKLTEKYYQKQAWPEAEVIASLVNDGTLKNTEKEEKKDCKETNEYTCNRPSFFDFISRTVLPSCLFAFNTLFRTPFPLL